jgi:hypothetical protein
LLSLANEQRRLANALPVSLFSDLNFLIARQVAAAKTKSDQNQVDRLVSVAERIYNEFSRQAIHTMDDFTSIADAIHRESIDRAIARPSEPSTRVLAIPRNDLYHIILRNNNTFVAMAKVYESAGVRDKAIDVLKQGKVYHPFVMAQMRNVFGNDFVMHHKAILQPLCRDS